MKDWRASRETLSKDIRIQTFGNFGVYVNGSILAFAREKANELLAHLALDISKVTCDAYAFEKGDLFAINTFRGEYMANYSWAEVTTGYYVRLNERRDRG